MRQSVITNSESRRDKIAREIDELITDPAFIRDGNTAMPELVMTQDPPAAGVIAWMMISFVISLVLLCGFIADIIAMH